MAEKMTVGRRKEAVARVILRPGSGKITVNGKPMAEYLPTEVDYNAAYAPIKSAEAEGKYDFVINVKGGGTTGQVGAIRLGIARALVNLDEDLRPKLRKDGHLTRDPRMVERKKYGRPKARKRSQFSKR